VIGSRTEPARIDNTRNLSRSVTNRGDQADVDAAGNRAVGADEVGARAREGVERDGRVGEAVVGGERGVDGREARGQIEVVVGLADLGEGGEERRDAA